MDASVFLALLSDGLGGIRPGAHRGRGKHPRRACAPLGRRPGHEESRGPSLVAASLFGLTTAARDGLADKLDLPVAGLFLAGGIAAGFAGTALAHRLPWHQLRRIFAVVLVVVALHVACRIHAAFD